MTAPLTVGELRAAATDKTGLDDFGDDWFDEPLGVLVRSLSEEARLSELGHQMTRRRLVALLVDRLRLRELVRTHPAISDEQVTVAAEICGLPRTGSTLLHRLLASSPQLTSTASWETSYPLPFPGEPAEAPERKRRAQERMAAFLALSPEFADIHSVSWEAPEEDVILVDRSFTSMSFDSFYWAPSYGVWLRGFDQSRAYAELREWLQVLQWQDPRRGPDRRWVLKSPHHLTAAATVLDTFPGCKIIMTHRSPVEAVPSYASMVVSMTSQYSDAVDPVAVGRYWSARFKETLDGLGPVRAQHPDRFIDVHYKAVQRDPLAQAHQIMGSLGLPVTAEDTDAWTRYLEHNRSERHGTHSYSAEDFGLSAQQLSTDFAPYIATYLPEDQPCS